MNLEVELKADVRDRLKALRAKQRLFEGRGDFSQAATCKIVISFLEEYV